MALGTLCAEHDVAGCDGSEGVVAEGEFEQVAHAAGKQCVEDGVGEDGITIIATRCENHTMTTAAFQAGILQRGAFGQDEVELEGGEVVLVVEDHQQFVGRRELHRELINSSFFGHGLKFVCSTCCVAENNVYDAHNIAHVYGVVAVDISVGGVECGGRGTKYVVHCSHDIANVYAVVFVNVAKKHSLVQENRSSYVFIEREVGFVCVSRKCTGIAVSLIETYCLGVASVIDAVVVGSAGRCCCNVAAMQQVAFWCSFARIGGVCHEGICSCIAFEYDACTRM